MSRDWFEKVKRATLKQVRARLDFYAAGERGTLDPDGLAIEYALDRVNQLVGARTRKQFHGIATGVEHNFSSEQRRTIFEWLLRIEESAPWRGVSLNVFD